MLATTATSQLTDSRVKALHSLFKRGRIPGPVEHEVHPKLPQDSRENYLYFTLTPSLNFQRNSPALWRSALSTYLDPATTYLFRPEEVVRRKRDTVARDLAKHRLAIQTNRHPKIWYELCQTLHGRFESDPRVLLSAAGNSISSIIRYVQIDKREWFPGLRGQKLSNYWLFILLHFTDVAFADLHELSIIPDTHVIQATAQLGLTAGPETPEAVEAVWRSTLQRLQLSPVEMHSALWRWSRNNFLPEI